MRCCQWVTLTNWQHRNSSSLTAGDSWRTLMILTLAVILWSWRVLTLLRLQSVTDCNCDQSHCSWLESMAGTCLSHARPLPAPQDQLEDQLGLRERQTEDMTGDWADQWPPPSPRSLVRPWWWGWARAGAAWCRPDRKSIQTIRLHAGSNCWLTTVPRGLSQSLQPLRSASSGHTENNVVLTTSHITQSYTVRWILAQLISLFLRKKCP